MGRESNNLAIKTDYAAISTMVEGVSLLRSSHPAFDVLRKLNAPVWVYDTDNNKIHFANTAALSLWNATTEQELCSRDLSEGMSTVVAERLKQYQRDFTRRSATFTENWTVYPKGSPRALKILFSGFPLPDGRMAMLCEALNELHNDADNLRRTDALLHADVMVSMYAEAGPPIYFNPAARKAAVSTTDFFRNSFVDDQDYQDLMLGVDEKGEHRSVSRMRTKTGVDWLDCSVRRCTDPATGNPAILVTAFNVTELKTARDTARYLAETDPLTDCYNRNYLNHRLNELMQTGSAMGAGVLYFDLDHFKKINDTFGHHVGDEVLKETAARVRATLSPYETLARLGGDEFILLMESIGSAEKLRQRGEEICAILRQPIVLPETRLSVSASVGAAMVAEGVIDWSQAMWRADTALYQSKLVGRNRCSLFSEEMGRAASERAQLQIDLVEAVEKDQFELHFQPRINLTTGRVDAAEALVRWRHPTRGLVPPNAFIPLCEETGIIETLGSMIIMKACQHSQKWQEQGLDIDVSINVSPRQFDSAELLRTIEQVAQSDEFDSNKIEFEITESVLVGDSLSIVDRLNTIHNQGFRIAVDDFGTGYSNLANISRFPLHFIKIDKCFVDQLPSSKPIVQLIITTAHQIGAKVVAEGVEEKSQVQILTEMGCDQVQGFYFSKPVENDRLKNVIDSIEFDPKDFAGSAQTH